jgi:hypothetical protein
MGMLVKNTLTATFRNWKAVDNHDRHSLSNKRTFPKHPYVSLSASGKSRGILADATPNLIQQVVLGGNLTTSGRTRNGIFVAILAKHGGIICGGWGTRSHMTLCVGFNLRQWPVLKQMTLLN